MKTELITANIFDVSRATKFGRFRGPILDVIKNSPNSPLVLHVLTNQHTNTRHGHRQPRKHQVSVKPQHPIPKLLQVALPASISSTAPSVITAINFNDKFDARAPID